MTRNINYSGESDSEENYNVDGKYSMTGESEYSRDNSEVPFDDDEILSVRHYSFTPLEEIARKRIRQREPRSASPYDLARPFQSFRGRGPKGYRRTDETIGEDVSEALYRSSEVDASDIEVSVKKGIVTLKGTVHSREQKKNAESCIENLAGIEDIYNDLTIKQEYVPGKKSKYGLMDNITGMN